MFSLDASTKQTIKSTNKPVQVTSQSLVLDPFVGTGSLLVSAAHWGAYCIGTDIDYHTIVGKGDEKTIQANFRQYKLRQPDILRADQSNPCYRSSSFCLPDMQVDAIICDPPYGVWPCSLVCDSVQWKWLCFLFSSKLCNFILKAMVCICVSLMCCALVRYSGWCEKSCQHGQACSRHP
jgi:hypothetical protein